MNTPATPAAAKPTATKKTEKVTIALSVTYDAKEDMTIGDLTAEGQKALTLFAEAKKLGEVTGHVAIGKQKFALK